jgi:hypothetical protein
MREMQSRLASDAGLQATYAHAHQRYLEERDRIESVPEIADVSAGGMPNRVKCLHVLVGQALASGPGTNPFGDEAVAELQERRLVNGATCAERSDTG